MCDRSLLIFDRVRSLCGGEMKGRSLVVDVWLKAIVSWWGDECAIAVFKIWLGVLALCWEMKGRSQFVDFDWGRSLCDG
ncbi:MAG: hypothetical protein DCF20_19135 [Pseudanabaena sp.]|nr:MAG: hypothetical protein DCF20_19135 [Pseudanabaena sp.]